MVVNKKNLLRDLKNDLNQVHVINEEGYADLILNVELILYASYLIKYEGQIDELWSLFLNYDYPIVPKDQNTKIINKIRHLSPEYRNKYYWKTSLTQYFKIEVKYRLFTNDGKLNVNKPKFCTYREVIYQRILNNELDLQENESGFISNGKFKYYRNIAGETIPFSGTIPHSVNLYKQRLPRYKNKMTLTFSLPLELEDIVLEMERLYPDGNYSNRLKTMEIKSVQTNSEKIFKFAGVQHVAGGLSAGKSTWMVIESYRQVTRNQAKIGFIEGSVSQVLKRVEELKKLGLKAVPLIGKGSRRKHEEKLLVSYEQESRNLNSSHQYLLSVSDICTIKALADDEERNNFYPCKSLIQDGNKKKICPLANTCGIYHEWTALLDADIWITTPAALLSTKIPPSIDIYDRSIYQAMYDLLDIIFVDEADAVQKQFDDFFCNEIGAFGNHRLFFESLIDESNSLLNGRYNKFAGNPLILKWNENLKALDSSIWRLYEKLKKAPIIREDLKKELIFPSKLANWLLKKIKFDNEEQKNACKIDIHSILDRKHPSQLSNLYNSFLRDSDEKEEYLRLAYQLLTNKEQENEQEIKTILEFYFYFVSIDYHMTFLLQNYTAVQNTLGMGYELSHLINSKRDFNPILKGAMTGSFIGYRYSEEDESIGSFRIIEYSGVGRVLLNDWTSIYKEAFHKEGPAVNLLSGTSYLPGSNHYNIDINPTWLIKSTLKQPTIVQKYLPFFDENQKLINISGIKLHERPKKIEQLLFVSKNHIIQELHHLKDEKRRMLIVVNSYDDVAAVGRAFLKLKELENKYALLTNNDEIEEQDQYFLRFEIEEFLNCGKEILVVPLMSIGRGFNILDEYKGALFGTCIFLTRPYPTPNDMRYIVQTLHAMLPIYLNDIANNGETLEKAANLLRYKSIRRLEAMYQTPNFWSLLNDPERESLAWYMFVPIWQMIGRMLRGGRNARVYYLDGKFHSEKEGVPTLIDTWNALFGKNRNNELYQELYGPFINSLEDLSRKGE